MIRAWFIDKHGGQYYMVFDSEDEMARYTKSAIKKGHTRIAFAYEGGN